MPLIPRWRYMTPQARQQTRRMAIGAGILVLVILLKLPLPWVLLARAGWWLWGQLQR